MNKLIVGIICLFIIILIAIGFDCFMGKRTGPFVAYVNDKIYHPEHTEYNQRWVSTDSKGDGYFVSDPTYYGSECILDLTSTNGTFTAHVSVGFWNNVQMGERVSVTARIGKWTKGVYLPQVSKLSGTEW